MNKEYSLYVARGEHRAYESEAFYSANRNYTLIFANAQPNGFIKVPDGAMGALTEAEKQWLARRKADINLETMKRQAAEIVELMEAFILTFEAALDEEKEGAENGGRSQ